jgi:hypothetical protein
LRGLKSARIKDQNVMIEDGRITEFKVNLSVTLVLDDRPSPARDMTMKRDPRTGWCGDLLS